MRPPLSAAQTASPSSGRASPPAESLLDCVVTAGAERGHVKESPRHGDVLHEMDLHVGIGKIGVRDERRRDAPRREDTPGDAGLEAEKQSE